MEAPHLARTELNMLVCGMNSSEALMPRINNKSPSRISILLAIFMSAFCYFWGTGFNELWPLAWLAPLPMLWLGLSETRWPVVFLSAIFAYFLGGLNILYYLETHLPIKVFFPGQITSSILFATIILISCQMIKRINTWYSVFIFPTAWVSSEFITAYFSSGGTVDSLAYSQISVFPIIQIASITGIWGVSFLLTLLPSAVAVTWFLRREHKKNRIILSLGFPVSIFLLVLAFGYLRVSISHENNIIKIGLLAVPETIKDILSKDPAQAERIAKHFIAQIPALKKENASMLVMPEKILTITAENQNSVLALFQKAAKESQVILVIGMNQIKSNEKYNTIFVINTNGDIMGEYHKQHMLPGPESNYVIGRKLVTISLPAGLAGLAICKDMDFVFPSRQYSKNGVGVMLVPALDFGIDDWLHAKPAIFRGIEGGYSVVRVAQWGLLSVTDAYGRVLALKKSSDKNAVFLVSDVPVGSGKTIYSRYGDWFAWVCGIVFLILSSSLLIKAL